MKVLFAAAVLTLAVAGPVAAQSYYGQGGHDQDYGRDYSQRGHGQGYSSNRHYNSGGDHRYSGYDYEGQRDVPGDFRCDAYWDRGRTDCDAGRRDQRRYSSQGHRGSNYRPHGYSRYNSGRGGGYYGHDQGYSQGGTAYQGTYGRPDVVYPGGGRRHGGGYAGGGVRDQHRVDWCRATYRSYDPASGYYRAYSGRLIFCG